MGFVYRVQRSNFVWNLVGIVGGCGKLCIFSTIVAIVSRYRVSVAKIGILTIEYGR